LTTTRFRLFYWFKYLVYRLIVNISFKRAEKIVVPSNWWKKRLKTKYDLEKGKIKVVYESVSDNFKNLQNDLSINEKSQVLAKFKLKKPYVVYTGNLYPHKNVYRLAKAIKLVNEKRRLFLVVIGAKGVFWQRLLKKVREIRAEDSVILAGFVSDQEIPLIYEQAEAFVFPSLLEGFGLTGLEAMAVGLPVVCSRASCLPEIYQDAALYFHPKKAKDIARKIVQIIEDEKLREDLINKGFIRVKDFSWEKMARETLEVYQSVI
jgi:glycosyltransferase involved in cell wall biosynthesis